MYLFLLFYNRTVGTYYNLKYLCLKIYEYMKRNTFIKLQIIIKYEFCVIFISSEPINRLGSFARFTHSDSLIRIHSPIFYETPRRESNSSNVKYDLYLCSPFSRTYVNSAKWNDRESETDHLKFKYK